MLIFIDESGNFQTTAKPNRISCVTALVVPEAFARTLFRRFRKTIRPWLNGQREIKGSQLSEDQVATVIKVLRKFDVLLFAACVDMGLHTEAGITAHKNDQADRFLKATERPIQPGMKKDIEVLAGGTRDLANQLFTQAVVLNEVVDHVFRYATLYYAQRIPKTLGSFKWIVDAKDRTITNYEKIWSQIVSPHMQYKSLLEPMSQLNGADYSAFARFQKESAAPPDYLKDHVKDKNEPFLYTDLREILTSNLRFADSKKYSGLQIADIAANVIARACNGNLQQSGWNEIGHLMLQNVKGKNALRLLALEEIKTKDKLPYNDLVKKFDNDCKQMLTRR